MSNVELFIEDLSDAKDKLPELSQKRQQLASGAMDELCKNVADIFERYERDIEKRAENEQKKQFYANLIHS